MSVPPAILWFRQDLRLDDNPALRLAVEQGGPVIPVYLWSPGEEGPWPPGAASRWWLHGSLAALGDDLRRRGSDLVLIQGEALAQLPRLVKETGARSVCWNRRYEPAAAARDQAIERALHRQGVQVHTGNSALLWEPWDLRTGSGGPYQVFTPFWRKCLALPEPESPRPAPRSWAAPARWPQSLPLQALGLLPGIDWAAGLRQAWQPGEAGASDRLRRFLAAALADYPRGRDRPDLPGTSSLSPHLHFGEISPRRLWHRLREHRQAAAGGVVSSATSAFLREVGWREFAYHLLHHFPRTPSHPLKEKFAAFPWRTRPASLRAWQRGRTGYPIVDAGMRQLWTTGWMHNRVRMVVASFLVKDLLIPWQEGARWFWDTLVDADLASNTLGWQWTAGCGADAAPFFRIFNPVAQGAKFDPDGAYVRRWVPELAALPAKWIHRPWEAPPAVLREAGVEIGRTYPRPIVDHAEARARALAALASLRQR